MLAVGDLGVDSASRLNPAQLAADGAKFIFRYSAGVGNTSSRSQWKLCEPGEIAAVESTPIPDRPGDFLVFFPNSEWYEGRVEEGRPAGLADGKADLIFWKSRNLEAGRHIRVSWDTTPAPAKWRRVSAYLKAYEEGLGGYYHIALPYAGTPFLVWLSKQGWVKKLQAPGGGWRPNAGSWSNDGLPYQPNTRDAAHRAAFVAHALQVTPAAFVQTGNYWYDKKADENIIIRLPEDAPLPPVPDVPPPKPPAPGRHRAAEKAAIIRLLRQVIRLVEAL